MEEAGIELFQNTFLTSKINPGELPSLVLAYVGDAVYELAVREYLVTQGMVKVNKLHREAVRYVRAHAQAQALFAIEGNLSEEEGAVVRRGRNAKSATIPKNADVIEYRHATAFEALVGYLYLQGNHQRVKGVIETAIQAINQDKTS